MITHIHFQTIPVTDTARALAFYRDVIGFEVERGNLLLVQTIKEKDQADG